MFDSFWAPVNWRDLDIGDTDLGGCSGTLIDVPGANPSQLVLALGKDRNAYLLDRNNLGGVGPAVATMNVSNATLRSTSSAAYRTGEGTTLLFIPARAANFVLIQSTRQVHQPLLSPGT